MAYQGLGTRYINASFPKLAIGLFKRCRLERG